VTEADQKTLDEVYASPSVEKAPVEAILARATVRRAVIVGPLIVVAAWLLRDAQAALAAAIGIVVVVGNFLLAGEILSRAARVSMKAYHAAALLGFVVRLGLITASMLLIAGVFEIDRTAMGVSAVVAYFALLMWEAWVLAKGPEREAEWKR
jgi:hypothetical protein